MSRDGTTERCYICGGVGRRSSFVLAAGGEIEGECPDCEGTGILPPPLCGATWPEDPNLVCTRGRGHRGDHRYDDAPIGYQSGGVIEADAGRRMSARIDANGGC